MRRCSLVKYVALCQLLTLTASAAVGQDVDFPAVVMIDRYDPDGTCTCSGVGFIAAPDTVVTARHTVLGYPRLKINLGPLGHFDVTEVLAESEADDLIALGVDLPNGLTRIEVSELDAEPGVDVERFARMDSGEIRRDKGVVGFQYQDASGSWRIQTTIPGDFGDSGSPVIGGDARLVGVVVGGITSSDSNEPAESLLVSASQVAMLLLEPAHIPFERWYAENEALAEVKRAVAQAMTLQRDGQYEAVVAVLEPLIDRHPDELTGTNLLVYALHQLERSQEARTIIDRFAQATADDHAAQVESANLYLAIDALDEASDSLRCSLAIKETGEAWGLIAVIHANQGRFAEAIEAGERALALNYHTPDTLLAMGVAHVASDQFAEAGRMLRSVLRLDPENAHAFRHFGYVSYRIGDALGAIEHLARADELQPFKDERSLKLYGHLLSAHGRVADAQSVCDRLRDVNPFAANRLQAEIDRR